MFRNTHMSLTFGSQNKAVQMDSQKNKNENKEERDDDPVELPPDTLAILQEFLQNQNMQKSLESEDMFEENWVKSISIHELY